jgi:hypothetical protein
MSQKEALELVFQKLHDGRTWEKRGQSIINLEVLMGTSN